MTIAQAFNEITIAQGGTPSKGGTITGAIDALNDALAGSDQKPAQTIEGAIRLLGEHINTGGGGGGGGTEYSITCCDESLNPIASVAYNGVPDIDNHSFAPDIASGTIAKALPGAVVCLSGLSALVAITDNLDYSSAIVYPGNQGEQLFTMPAHDVYVIVGDIS